MAGCAADGVEIDEAWTARNENEVGRLRRRVRLRSGCGGCVNDGKLKIPLLCRFQGIGQPSFCQIFDVRRLTFASVCPDGGTFLLVEIAAVKAQRWLGYLGLAWPACINALPYSLAADLQRQQSTGEVIS